MFQSVQEIQDFCQSSGVQMIDFKTVDLMGRWHQIGRAHV